MTLKDASLSLCRDLGISYMFGRTAWRRRRLLILCYHGISLADEHEWNPAMYLSPDVFERRLRTIERLRCNVLPLGEALERLYRGDLPDRAVALTFDDGYFDFQERAYPRLAASGYPATVYLNTQRCEHNRPIVNLSLSYLLWKGRAVGLDGTDLPGLDSARHDLRTPAQRLRVWEALRAGMEREELGLTQKDGLVRTVAERVGVGDGPERARVLTLLRPAEVTRLSSQGVDFQLHTHRHRTPEDPARFLEEIVENRRRIEAMTGKPAVHFCYPSGVVRRGYFEVLEGAGVVSATTTQRGTATASTYRLLLPRFVDSNEVGDANFEAWLTGVGSWLRDAASVFRGRAPSAADFAPARTPSRQPV